VAKRVQIWFTDEEYFALKAEADRTRISMAEHVRTYVDRELLPHNRPPRSGFVLTFTRRPDEPFAGRRPGIRLD
jgi:hypothetical protein